MLHLDVSEQESVARKWVKLRVTNTAEQRFSASHACPLPCLGDVSVERLFRQGGSLQRESFRQRNQGLLMFVWSSREFIHESGGAWMVKLNGFIFIWLHKYSCAALLTGSPWHWGTRHLSQREDACFPWSSGNRYVKRGGEGSAASCPFRARARD